MEKFGKPEDGKMNKAKQYVAGVVVGAVGALVGTMESNTARDGDRFDGLLHTPSGIYHVVGLGEDVETAEVFFRDETGQNKFSVTSIPQDVKEKLMKEYHDETHELKVLIQGGGVKIIKEVE
jgi:hypothetical protein